MIAKNDIPRAVNKREKHHCRLYELRMAKKMSQRELAELSGVARNTIMRIENGDVTPNMATIQKLCKALNVSIGEVF
ncbi:MAG: helix-turn-helix transcriptional regulator [Oscillospiraceae bacterium]|nr:helix-turn-helix transcriptional regulator [Oscillospiraceae bacterium]